MFQITFTNRDVLEAPPLSDVAQFLGQYVAFPSTEARDAAALWAAHTHVIDAFETTPRLSISSPEKQSGKTRVLEVLELVVARPLSVVNVSVSALFRSIDVAPPTLLWDEVDALFRGGNDPSREDLRALLNAGYRRGNQVLRCVGLGANLRVQAFLTFAPVALAGIGELPDTVADRSIHITMRRRRPDEPVRKFRIREAKPEGAQLWLRLDAWAGLWRSKLKHSRPRMPDGLSDRAEDLWEPLLGIADAVGGEWPERARTAASVLRAVGRDRDGSRGVQLLADIKVIFSEHPAADALPTAALLESLTALDESPWGDIRGKPLDPRVLAKMLRPYGVKPGVVHVQTVTFRGYRRAAFTDCWGRYLPPLQESVPSVPSVHGQPMEVDSVEVDRSLVTGRTDRTVPSDVDVTGQPLAPLADELSVFPASTGTPHPADAHQGANREGTQPGGQLCTPEYPPMTGVRTPVCSWGRCALSLAHVAGRLRSTSTWLLPPTSVVGGSGAAS